MSHPDTDGVEWEMVTRFRWDGSVAVELRAISPTELEISVTTENVAGGATGSRRVLFADVRKALDELERSAREIERLPS